MIVSALDAKKKVVVGWSARSSAKRKSHRLSWAVAQIRISPSTEDRYSKNMKAAAWSQVLAEKKIESSCVVTGQLAAQAFADRIVMRNICRTMKSHRD